MDPIVTVLDSDCGESGGTEPSGDVMSFNIGDGSSSRRNASRMVSLTLSRASELVLFVMMLEERGLILATTPAGSNLLIEGLRDLVLIVAYRFSLSDGSFSRLSPKQVMPATVTSSPKPPVSSTSLLRLIDDLIKEDTTFSLRVDSFALTFLAGEDVGVAGGDGTIGSHGTMSSSGEGGCVIFTALPFRSLGWGFFGGLVWVTSGND